MWQILCLITVFLKVIGGTEHSDTNFVGFVSRRVENSLSTNLRDAWNTYIPQLENGIPNFNIPSCEPLLIPPISSNHAGIAVAEATFANITVRGPSGTKIDSIQVLPDKRLVIARLFIPQLRMTGGYKLKGKLLVIPIQGEGDFSAIYDDIDAVMNITLGRKPGPNNMDILSCENLDIELRERDANVRLHNLVALSDEIKDGLNLFLERQWLANDLRTALEQALKDVFKNLADNSLGKYKADDVLSAEP